MDLNLIKLKGLAFLEGRPGRITFRWKDLPEGVHITLSWDSPHCVNLHVTKRIKGQKKSFRADVVLWSKKMAARFSDVFNSAIWQSLYTEKILEFSSHRSRNKFKILFFDTIEQDVELENIKRSVTKSFRRHSKINPNEITIQPELFLGLITPKLVGSFRRLFRNHFHSLKPESFYSIETRLGLLKYGRKYRLFISQKGKCYVMRQDVNLFTLLSSFLPSELATKLLDEFKRAVYLVSTSITPEECRMFSSPIELYFEDEYPDGFTSSSLA
jgi:hypothetical protein